MTTVAVTKVEAPAEWGWLRYKGTYLSDATGRKVYEGYLREIGDTFSWTLIRTQFAAKSPTKALRAACAEKRTTQEVIDFLDDWKD
jgi:hypothetical protein